MTSGLTATGMSLPLHAFPSSVKNIHEKKINEYQRICTEMKGCAKAPILNEFNTPGTNYCIVPARLQQAVKYGNIKRNA